MLGLQSRVLDGSTRNPGPFLRNRVVVIDHRVLLAGPILTGRGSWGVEPAVLDTPRRNPRCI